jgi:EAL domain-containing protein (putative c-di-GMP-specific phosphodiesterase class I)
LASFAYLKHLPVDFLKIDGTFVKNIVRDPVNLAIVKATNEIGHALGIKTIAEYVEDVETLEAVRLLGVDYGQGFGIARPMPLETFEILGPAAEQTAPAVARI